MAMLLAALVTGLALAPGPASAADAPAVEAFGINGGFLWRDGLRPLPTATHAAAIARTGIRTVRTPPVWGLVEPNAPDPRTGKHRFDWSSTDLIARDLATNGLRWDAVLCCSTTWGSVLPGTNVAPPQVKPFSEYAAAVAERYGRRGGFWRTNPDLPYVPMVNFQVWNEPNLPGSWFPSPQPERYAELYAATRTAVLAVDPHARVSIGALAHSAPDSPANASGFLRAMFRARPQLAGAVDAVGLTIYRPTAEQVLAQVVDARSTLDELGERSTPLDVSETGWTTQGSVPLTDIAPVSEAQRGVLLTRLVELLTEADCGVGNVSPFAWVTAQDNPLDASEFFGLADERTAALKPSGAALTGAIRRAGRADLPQAAPCGRADLRRLVAAPVSATKPFGVSVTRRCRTRRLAVRFGVGDAPEPLRRFVITGPGGVRRTVTDPDGAGPAAVATNQKFRLARRPRGRVTVVALDELDRERASEVVPLSNCRVKRR